MVIIMLMLVRVFTGAELSSLCPGLEGEEGYATAGASLLEAFRNA